MLQAVDVGGAETEFARARFQDDVVCAEGLLEGFGPREGAVGGCVVDDYDFPGEVSGSVSWGLDAPGVAQGEARLRGDVGV